jgi:Amt family ammonium transporter
VGENKVIADTLWTMIAGFLVFFMNLGFAMLEAGLQRSKNAVNILAKNFIVFAISSISFFTMGWGIMFGDGNDFLGLKGVFFVLGEDNSPAVGENYTGVYKSISWASVPLWAKFFFQLVFAGTSATIVSGAVGERIKFRSFIFFSFLMVALIYPIVGHWIWGGGWLGKMGFIDFAGSTVVHSVGGWAALTGAILLGPRLGKYRNGKIYPIPGHNLALATLGTFILWFGWFGFNPGSTMSADFSLISKIATVTNISASASTLSALLTSWFLMKKPDLTMILNGCLAGLVAITAPCAFVSPISAIIIGFIAGVIVVLSVLFFDRIKIDDPVGATSVHLVCGMFGTLAVGIFHEKNGLIFSGEINLLKVQLIGVVTVGIFTFLFSLIIWLAIKLTFGLRVSPQEEIEGLDLGEHGQLCYPEFITAEQSYLQVEIPSKEEKKISKRKPPKTEVETPEVESDRVFKIKVENVDRKALVKLWRDLCSGDWRKVPVEFKEIYQNVKLFSADEIVFSGGNPNITVERFSKILNRFGLKGFKIKVIRE